MNVIVTHRNYTDKLTSLWTEKYRTVAEAKAAIKLDAKAFLNAHQVGRNEPLVLKFKQVSKWVNPKTEDYFMACGQDGTVCYWQYFICK